MQDQEERSAQIIGLSEILRIITRRWRWVAGGIVALTAVALLLSVQQEPKYVAHATVLLRTVASDDSVGLDPTAQVPFFADRQVTNELATIESRDVQKAVEKEYSGKLPVSLVTASVTGIGTDVVELSATAGNADEVADLVNAYTRAYIKYNQNQKLDSLVALRAQIQDRVDGLDQQRAEVYAPLDAVEKQLAAAPTNLELLGRRNILAAQLQPSLDAIDTNREAYIQQLQDLQISEGIAPTAGAKLLTEAVPPAEPTSPKPVRDGIVGFMAGVALGLALALAREFFDESIRATADVERVVKGAHPILGVIPEAEPKDLLALADVTSTTPVAEAYRALRTSVRFAELDRPMKVIQVTSPAAGEGKTTTAEQLATVLTQAGHRVAIACCDLRRPQIHNRFGMEVAPGLVDVVLGECTLADAIRPVNDLLYLLPAGSFPPNPSEILGSRRAELVIRALGEEMDYVIIDTTPVLPVTDAIVVSRFVDATMIVVASGTTRRNQLSETLRLLDQAQAPIIGVVFNRAEVGDRNAYGYSYGTSRYIEAGSAKGKSKRKGRNNDKGGVAGPVDRLPQAAGPAVEDPTAAQTPVG
jgi:succinoglycan biosynthesis transport protein ExoP